MFLFASLSILSGIFDGGGGILATKLTAPMSEISVIAAVSDTTGFLSASVLYIANEVVYYTGKDATHFTGLSRGQEKTAAKAHITGTSVYSESAGVINAALGFNPTSLIVDNAFLTGISIVWAFFTRTLPRIIFWNYSFLQGELITVRYILMAISVGLIIALAIQIGTRNR